MINLWVDPFKECPVFETEQFRLRLVEEKDASDLLKCYSDSASAPVFNSDDCLGDFIIHDEENVLLMIKAWLREYNEGGYVRFSIVDKTIGEAIGTIEFFAKEGFFDELGRVGLLRLDLRSEYEQHDSLEELLNVVEGEFPETFTIDSIMTKAVPYAKIRRDELLMRGYHYSAPGRLNRFDDYFVKRCTLL